MLTSNIQTLCIIYYLVGSTLSTLAVPGSVEYVEITITVTFLVGIISLFFGLIHGGYVATFISHPVLHGFTNACAIYIGASQLVSYNILSFCGY